MTPIADLVRRLGAAGCSVEQIAVAVESQEQQFIEREARRSEKNAARQRKWRDKKRPVTSQDVTERNKEPSADSALTTLLPSSSVSDSQIKKEEIVARARPVNRGSRISSDWTPSNSDACFALPLLGERRMAQETEKFRDYWRARAGPNGVKLDWEATWRTWIRKAAESGNGQRNSKPSPTMDAFDDLIARTGGTIEDDPPMRDITPRGRHLG